MMKRKFESLFILSTPYKMVEAENYEPAKKKKKEKDKKGDGKGKGERALVS